jgi:hypothetical protein
MNKRSVFETFKKVFEAALPFKKAPVSPDETEKQAKKRNVARPVPKKSLPPSALPHPAFVQCFSNFTK